jgi:hypothetical protein
VTDQLREAIRASGQSMNRICIEAGLSASQLSRFMTRKRGLTTEAVDKLCDVLGMQLAPCPARPAASAKPEAGGPEGQTAKRRGKGGK